jgi:hypothetical protein
MLLMGLQWAFTATAVAIALIALLIGRYRNTAEPFRALAWRFFGMVLSLYALSLVVQNAWGSWAMAAGSASGVMAGYLKWAPALNHSRTFLLVAFFGALSWFMLRRERPSRTVLGVGIAASVAGFLAGGWLGWAEGSLIVATHYTRVAVWDTVELVIVLGTLFVGLVTNRLDRHLWALLTTFGVVVALNIIYYAAISLVNDPRVWSPPPSMMGLYRLVLVQVMLAVAVRRLHLARRGISVGGLLRAAPKPAAMTMG